MKIRDLDLSDNPVNAEHQALGLPPIEHAVTHSADHPVLRFAMWSVVFLLMGVIVFLGTRLFNQPDGHTGFQIIAETLESRAFWSAVAVGLLAQTVDGALGMAYGITSTSFLLASGSSPAVALPAVAARAMKCWSSPSAGSSPEAALSPIITIRATNQGL